MKHCIWCNYTSDEVTFKKKAHTVPQSLGGKNICENVCDECNQYFGNIHNQKPAIETVLKEAFNISRARFLNVKGEVGGKNKTLPKFTSTYFDVNFKKGTYSVKARFRMQQGFQNELARQFRRGIYMLFLEEYERQIKGAANSKFDFIRSFSRFDEGDLPVFYGRRKFGAILVVHDWVKNPELIFDRKMKYLIAHDDYEEFEFLGHVFGIVKTENWQHSINDHLKTSMALKNNYFSSMININYLSEIDLVLNILDKNSN